jgi:DNA-binding XRE family transcriptional regulator
MKVRIKERREFLYMRQADLAKQVGIHPAAMSRIEVGKVLPNVVLAIKIAAALHAPVPMIWELEEGIDY